MKLKTSIILAFIFLTSIATIYAENKASQPFNSTKKEVKKIVTTPNQDSSHDNVTLSTKEFIGLAMTNNSINSLSLFITALGVLFTIMAIVVAIVIFMQSRDFKIKLKEATDKYELIIKQFIESKREDLKLQEEDLTKLISEFKQKLEASQPGKEGEIKEIISSLESKKEIVEKQLTNSVVNIDHVVPNSYPSSLNEYSTYKYHKCSQCKFGFMIREPGYLDRTILVNPIYNSLLSEKVAKCPNCGNVDKI